MKKDINIDEIDKVRAHCHLFFKKLVEKKHDKIKIDFIPKTNEEYKSVTYGCIRLFDSYRILSSSLYSLVETLFDENIKIFNIFKDLEKQFLEIRSY